MVEVPVQIGKLDVLNIAPDDVPRSKIEYVTVPLAPVGASQLRSIASVLVSNTANDELPFAGVGGGRVIVCDAVEDAVDDDVISVDEAPGEPASDDDDTFEMLESDEEASACDVVAGSFANAIGLLPPPPLDTTETPPAGAVEADGGCAETLGGKTTFAAIFDTAPPSAPLLIEEVSAPRTTPTPEFGVSFDDTITAGSSVSTATSPPLSELVAELVTSATTLGAKYHWPSVILW